MKTCAYVRAWAAIGLLAVPLVAGCSGGNRVTGKLVKNGAPVTVSDKGVIQMSLVKEDDKAVASPYPVTVNPKDGTFVVNANGAGSTPVNGKYRVAVAIYDPYPGKDQLGGRFTAQTSPIMREVSGTTDLTIDVAKAGG